MLEVLDELGVRPHRISGTSIGAILGAIYASGRTAREMRDAISELTATPKSLKEALEAKQLPGWVDFIGVELGRGSLLKIDRFLAALDDVIGVSRFEQLEIPLSVVAADFWRREEVVFGEKIRAQAPTILIEPEIRDVRVLEFHKADQIYEQARPARDELKRRLATLLV